MKPVVGSRLHPASGVGSHSPVSIHTCYVPDPKRWTSTLLYPTNVGYHMELRIAIPLQQEHLFVLTQT
jgi:hypothetical protein